MNTPNFTFPPPPPPPPPQTAFSSYPAPNQSSYGYQHGFNRTFGGPSRGRGRGDSHRGAGGSMYRGHGNMSSPNANAYVGPPRGRGYFGGQSGQAGLQVPPNPTTSYMAPQNTTYANSYGPRPYGQVQSHAQSTNNMSNVVGPPIRMGFDTAHPHNNHGLPSHVPMYEQPGSMRWNGDPGHHDRAAQNTRFQHPRYPNRPSNSRHTPNGRQLSKLGGSSTPGRLLNSLPRPQAAPAVPSFGNPLPVKPPAPDNMTRAPKKKKRQHNQLGLTPKAEEHESSEEDDVDEEAKLAAAVAGAGADQKLLQFSYRGRTATLQSAADIAAWIEERRRRYPTKARREEAAEHKRKLKEEQLTASTARREMHAKRNKEFRERKEQQRIEKTPNKHENAESEATEAALKARLKAEKLRRKLYKEEKKVAKAEAAALEAKAKVEALQNGGSQQLHTKRKRDECENAGTSESVVDRPSETASDCERPSNNVTYEEHPAKEDLTAIQESVKDGRILDTMSTMEPPVLASTVLPKGPEKNSLPAASSTSEVMGAPGALSHAGNDAITDDLTHATDSDSDDITTISSSSSEPSSNEDETSSSGSSSDDEAPDEAPSKLDGPQRVAPPERRKPQQTCRQFIRTGRCSRGRRCKFLHTRPEHDSRYGVGSRYEDAKREKGPGAGRDKYGRPEPERKSLFQRLVEQERDKENKHILQAIIYLGQNGLLDPPKDGTEVPTSKTGPGSEAIGAPADEDDGVVALNHAKEE